MSDGGYWVNSPENPFNQMDYTRGGGGYDNASTTQSNANRAFAMAGSGNSMPRYANSAEAHKAVRNGNVPVFNTVADAIAFAKKYRLSDVLDVAGGVKVHTAALGFADLPQVSKPVAKPVTKPVAKPGKPVVKVPATDQNGKPVAAAPGGVGPATPNPQTVGPTGPGPGREMTGVFGGSGAGSKLVVSNPEALADPISLAGSDKVRYLEYGDWPLFGPVSWAVTPGVVDAQDIEDIYGDDIVSLPALGAKLAVDTRLNVNRFAEYVGRGGTSVVTTLSDNYRKWPVGVDDGSLPDPMSIKPMSEW